MEITLPPELEAYVQQRVRGGAFVSATEFIQEAVRRKMENDSWMEQKVLEAEQSELSPLTRGDLESVRSLIRQPRATRLFKRRCFLEDYREVVLQIADANPLAADRFCDAVEAALELFASHPDIGPKAGFPRAPDVRMRPLRQFPNYLIFTGSLEAR